MEWISKHVDLGELKSRKPVVVKFQYLQHVDEMSVQPTCGCSVAEWDKDNREIIVIYTPDRVPEHFKLQGQLSYRPEKKVVINMKDSTDILIFTAQVSD